MAKTAIQVVRDFLTLFEAGSLQPHDEVKAMTNSDPGVEYDVNEVIAVGGSDNADPALPDVARRAVMKQ